MSTATQQLRNGVASLSTLANRDLAGLWRQVSSAVQAREALADVLPALVDKYGTAAAAMAAHWYDDLRDKSGVRGSFTAIPAALGDTGADALAGWGIGPLFKEDPDWAAAQALVAGGLQRRIANAGRATVMSSSIADPAAGGWQRVTGGNACGFCRMLAGKGAVYGEATADFGAHDHCNCAAVPAFAGQPRLVRPVKDYSPSERRLSPQTRAKNNARAREWMRDHGLTP